MKNINQVERNELKKASGEGGLLYQELSYVLIGIMYEVHNQLGPGFTEDIYEKAVATELEIHGIPYEKQKVVEVYYKKKLMGTYRLDLVVEDKIILELKAVTALNDVYREQLLSYLKATGLRLGILVNFGAKSVERERVVN
ncbi:MAG: GxxExxY protein [Chloroflexi bacterium]|nr:MAG: GxxExxY protein [Chloroflexota bacterium]